MNLPKQSAPVRRDQTLVKVVSSANAVSQSGCCVQVAGVCLASSPFC